MRDHLDEIHAAGGELVLVGNGSPEAAKAFQSRFAPGIKVLTDPGREVFRRFGLKRGVMATIGPQTWLGAARAVARGHLQAGTQGDPWQQGGLFVIAPGGEVVFDQRYQHAAERPDIQGALRALHQAAERRSARKRSASG